MCHSAKLSMWFVLLLSVVLTACVPAATPVSPVAPAQQALPKPTIRKKVDVKGQQIRLDLHKEYLNLSTDSSLILAKKSGHFIQNDEPQLVIDAILGLVEKARQK